MLRITILLVFAKIIAAKFISSDDFFGNGVNVHSVDPVGDSGAKIRTKPLWILTLRGDSLECSKLRYGDIDDEEYFDEIAGPLISDFKRRKNTAARANVNNRTTETTTMNAAEQEVNNANGKRELLRIINKFALHGEVEPDAYLSTVYYSGPSIELYFKDGFTSVILTIQDRVWHLFMPPPSKLSPWFFEDHFVFGIAPEFVVVPADIKENLYATLAMFFVRLHGFASMK